MVWRDHFKHSLMVQAPSFFQGYKGSCIQSGVVWKGTVRSWFVESLQLMTHSPHLNEMGKSQQNPSGWVPWILVRFSLKWMYQLQCSWKETLFVYLPYHSPPQKKKTTPRTGMNNIMTHFHLKCSLLVAATLVTRYEIHVYHAHHVYHVYMYVFVSALSFMVQTFGMEVPICADCMLPRGSETSKLELSKRIDTLHRYCNKASKWLWSILVIVSTKKKISKVSQDVQVRSNKMMLSRKIWHTIPQHLKSLPTKTNDLLEPFSFLEDLPECRWHLIPRSMQWNDVRSLWKLKRLSPKIQPQLSI